jgi:hypothetical protein
MWLKFLLFKKQQFLQERLMQIKAQQSATRLNISPVNESS